MFCALIIRTRTYTRLPPVLALLLCVPCMAEDQSLVREWDEAAIFPASRSAYQKQTI
jgi:hypothetical protein